MDKGRAVDIEYFQYQWVMVINVERCGLILSPLTAKTGVRVP